MERPARTQGALGWLANHAADGRAVFTISGTDAQLVLDWIAHLERTVDALGVGGDKGPPNGTIRVDHEFDGDGKWAASLIRQVEDPIQVVIPEGFDADALRAAMDNGYSSVLMMDSPSWWPTQEDVDRLLAEAFQLPLWRILGQAPPPPRGPLQDRPAHGGYPGIPFYGNTGPSTPPPAPRSGWSDLLWRYGN